MTSLDATLSRLLTLHPRLIDLSLDRMWRILERLDHPEKKLPPVIHVAGTNGKGSTMAFMRAMLEAAGKAVHVYTSPHLVRFNERFRLAAPGGGKLVDRFRARKGACTNANAPMPANRSQCSRLRPQPVFFCFRADRRTSCCWRSVSAAGSTQPMWSSGRSSTSSRRCRSITRTFSAIRLSRWPARKPALSSAAFQSWSRRNRKRHSCQDRGTGGETARAAQGCRRALDGERRAPPPGLSGR